MLKILRAVGREVEIKVRPEPFQVAAAGCAKGCKQVFVDMIRTLQDFRLEGYASFRYRFDVDVVITDVPLPRRPIVGMGAGADAEVMLVVPVAAVMS